FRANFSIGSVRIGFGRPLPSDSSMMIFEEIQSEYPDLSAKLGQYEPIKSAASIAGLQTMPAMQPYDLRIEALIRLVLAIGHGTQHPSNSEVDSWLAELGEEFVGGGRTRRKGLLSSTFALGMAIAEFLKAHGSRPASIFNGLSMSWKSYLK